MKSRTQTLIARRASSDEIGFEPSPSPPTSRIIRRAAAAGIADPSALVPSSGGGAPLPDVMRSSFERSTGADLSSVRVHTGAASQESASQLAARAYAVGTDIHFGAGQYDPSSRDGQVLIAHEVAHTVQHLGGAVARQPMRKSMVSSPGDACEVEADRMAEAMVAGQPTGPVSASSAIHRFVDAARALWARDFIQSAPPEVIPVIVQQIRSARGTRTPEVSGEIVRLTLGDGSTSYPPQSGTILFEDLNDLLAEARARQPAPPAGAQHTEHPNPTPPGHPMPSTTDREPTHTLPAQPSGVEGTPDQARLDTMVHTVQADLAQWQLWRSTMNGPMPGHASYAAANASPERRIGTDGSTTTYLQRALGANDLQALSEMCSLNYTTGGQVLAEMFGVHANPYVHTTYRMRIDGDDATVTYQNEYGMRYSHQFTIHQHMWGRHRERDSHVVLVGENHTSIFHGADYFTGPYVMTRVQLGGANQTFIAMQYVNGLEFQLFVQGGTIGAGAQAGGGVMTDDGHHQSSADPVPPGVEPETVPDGGTRIYRASIYFDTGSAEIPPGGNDALAATIHHIDQFRAAHPSSPIQVQLTGFASPRWRGAGNDQQADQNNEQLSQQRVGAIEAQLRNAEHSNNAGGHCDFRNQVCPAPDEISITNMDPPQADGSTAPRNSGVARTEDPPAWRRVEIVVLGQQYRESQVHNQPSPPATSP